MQLSLQKDVKNLSALILLSSLLDVLVSLLTFGNLCFSSAPHSILLVPFTNVRFSKLNSLSSKAGANYCKTTTFEYLLNAKCFSAFVTLMQTQQFLVSLKIFAGINDN